MPRAEEAAIITLSCYPLKNAVKTDLIAVHPVDKVKRPKKNTFVGNFYDKQAINDLFAAAKSMQLELLVVLSAFYGLRRSEVVGLKWDAVDFEANTITIRHTVTTYNLDSKRVVYASDTTKTKSSMRMLFLVPMFRDKLLALQAEQETNRKLCGHSYRRITSAMFASIRTISQKSFPSF